jgi:hypothetical protein
VNSRPLIHSLVASWIVSNAMSRQSAPLTKRFGSSGVSTGRASGFSLLKQTSYDTERQL